jgi:hypothetical protein
MTRPTILLFHIFVAAGTCLPSLCLATIGEVHIQIHRLMGEMGPGAVIYMYIPNFIKIGLGIQKLEGLHRHTDGMEIG